MKIEFATKKGEAKSSFPFRKLAEILAFLTQLEMPFRIQTSASPNSAL